MKLFKRRNNDYTELLERIENGQAGIVKSGAEVDKAAVQLHATLRDIAEKNKANEIEIMRFKMVEHNLVERTAMRNLLEEIL